MISGGGAPSGEEHGDVPDLIRPFIITGGRTRGARPEIRMETLIEQIAHPPTVDGAETAAVLAACGAPTSVAEIAAYTNLPLGVVMILAGDLLDAGAVRLHTTEPVDIEVSTLSRMIERVRAL